MELYVFSEKKQKIPLKNKRFILPSQRWHGTLFVMEKLHKTRYRPVLESAGDKASALSETGDDPGSQRRPRRQGKPL